MENSSITEALANVELFDLSTRTIQKIVKRAKLNCAVCGWGEDTCDIHHILSRARGGSNLLENLVCICPNCHRKAHSKKISAEYLSSLSMKDFDWRRYYRQSRVKKIDVEMFMKSSRTLTPKELVNEYGIPLKSVYSILRANNTTKVERKTKFNVSKEELMSFVAEKPLSEIGKMFGVSDNAIKKRCVKLGIELKPMRGHWSKLRSLGR